MTTAAAAAARSSGKRVYRLVALVVALALVASAARGRAASAQYSSEVVAIDLAGRQTSLTHDPGAADLNPAAARDGRIVFLKALGSVEPDLYVMDGDGGNVRRLTNSQVDGSGVAGGDDLEFSQASWSPGGDRIVFDGKYDAGGPSCLQHCFGWRVLVIGSDGSGLAQVAQDARAPSWSPDGSSVAYESDYDAYDGWARSVTIARLDGSGSVRVKAFNTEGDIGPVWSPRGSELAFEAQPVQGSPTWIYTVHADGSSERRLARGHKPVWSPDGQHLAFINHGTLFTINRHGTHKRVLSRKGEFVVDAAWSPRGGTLAYLVGRRGYPLVGPPYDLRVETVSANGKHAHVIAREPAAALIWGRPLWTPDGTRVLVAVEAH